MNKIYHCLVSIALLLMVFLSKSFAQDPNFHIYLAFGQSNMEGMGTVEAQDRVTNARVMVLQDQTCSNLSRTYATWYTAAPPLCRCWGNLGPADWFAKTMADGMPATVKIGIVNTSVGGCDIALFQKSAPIGRANADIPAQFNGGYAWLLDLAKTAQKTGVIKGIIFHQGETNTGDPNWKYKVQEIVADLKKDLGLGDVPFLAGEVLQAAGNCCASHNTEIAKIPSVIPNSYVISSAGLAGADVAHFTSAAYRTLGIRYAQKMLTLVGGSCAATPIVPSVQVDGGAWQGITAVTITAGSTIKLGPQPITGGTWAWAGGGTAGTAREQTITPTTSTSATATYTNDCGSKSTITFTITVNPVIVPPTSGRALSNPNPSKEAAALYCYIQSIFGKKILSGQMGSSWGVDELAYIQTNTGKQPAIYGLDYITQSDNAKENAQAIAYWKKGGIPTVMWHWGAPSMGEGYDASKKKINIDNCFVAGTPEYTAFWSELKIKADLLQQLRDANVPVLWRPFHELNGGWFWWGMGTPAQFKKLWTTMYTYFTVDRKLNNLIWVLCYSGEPNGAWFPGNQYVDIAGADTYGSGNGPQKPMYDKVVNNIGGNKMPITYHECGQIPLPDQCLAQGAMWSWWMLWHTSYLEDHDKAALKAAYNHDLVLTLDELPNIMTACGTTNPAPTVTITAPANNSSLCSGAASIITATASIASGTITKLDFYDGATLLGTDKTVPYTCNWTSPTVGVHAIRVVATSALGETSEATASISIVAPVTIVPNAQIDANGWTNMPDITITAGQKLSLGPWYNATTGWNWTGPKGFSANTRELVFTPVSADQNGTFSVSYTDAAGCASTVDYRVTVLVPQTISLAKGWNLISINVRPADSSIVTLFKGLDVLEIKDMNSFWRKGQVDIFNGLKTITSGNGYLVNMNVAGTLTVTGVLAETDGTLVSVAAPRMGWNLIGCPYRTNTPMMILNNLTPKIVKNFDGFWMPASANNTINALLPGNAYFLKR